MMRAELLRVVFGAVLLGGLGFAAGACDDDPGDTIKDAADDVGDAVDDAADNVKDATN